MDSPVENQSDRVVVLFDGECNLCHGLLGFIARRDRRERFRFAALQAAEGRRLLAERALPDSMETVVLLLGQRAHLRSGAVLRIFARLRWPWPLLSVLLVVPWPLRDGCYRLFAAWRHRWFGRRDAFCAVPEEVRRRMLDEAGLPDPRHQGTADRQAGS